jgi:predicted RNA-binding Zn-ribbon protein involved in translation (DUF1610 family)
MRTGLIPNKGEDNLAGFAVAVRPQSVVRLLRGASRCHIRWPGNFTADTPARAGSAHGRRTFRERSAPVSYLCPMYETMHMRYPVQIEITLDASSKENIFDNIHSRPECPACGMAMITTGRTVDANGHDLRSFECLRCGHLARQETRNERRTRETEKIVSETKSPGRQSGSRSMDPGRSVERL